MKEPYIEVLLEGASDVPVLRHMLAAHFRLEEGRHFRLHPHEGKGRLPVSPLSRPELHHRGLLDQLPAKLRGYRSWMSPDALVLVVIDVDDQDCVQLLRRLLELREAIAPDLRVLFRLAIEETESWFLADPMAVKAAFPRAKIKLFQGVAADSVVGAWELLAQALGTGRSVAVDKYAWAEAIAPNLTFTPPRSPSLGKLVNGVKRYLAEMQT